MRDSVFNDGGAARDEKTRAVFASVAGHSMAGNQVLVTHAQNIQALTGLSPSPGELVVVSLRNSGKFDVIACLDMQSDNAHR